MRLNSDAVARRLKELSWSQGELARRMGLSRGYVSRLLQGKRGGGGRILDGLSKAFPGEDVMRYVILEPSLPDR